MSRTSSIFALIAALAASAFADYTMQTRYHYEDSATVENAVGFITHSGWTYTCNAPGYYITGWDLDDDWAIIVPGQQKPYNRKKYGAVNPLTIPTEDLVALPQGVYELSPHISMMHYTLAYDANGGTGTLPASADHNYNESVTSEAAICSRIGYTQTSWNTAANGSGKEVGFGKTFTGATFPVTNHQQSVTLYAQWKANEYKVTLAAPDADSQNFTTNITATYDSTPAKITSLPKRALWKFDGYYTGSNGSGDKYFDADGKATQKWQTTEVTKLYAKWVRYQCTLTFLHEGSGSVNPSGNHTYNSGDVIAPKATPDTNYRLVRWSDGETSETHSDIVVTSNATYTAYFSKVTYTITFKYTNKNNKDVTVSKEYEHGAKIEPPTDVQDIPGKKPEWEPTVPDCAFKNSEHTCKQNNQTYVVQFDGNGSTGGKMDSMPFEYDSGKCLTSNSFVRIGYTFAGWSTDSAAKTPTYTDGAALKDVYTNLFLYAIWSPNISYIAFVGNGATNETAMASQLFKGAETNALSANIYGKIGYTFAGWATNAADAAALKVAYTNCEEVSFPLAKTGETNTLYAVWATNHYTIVFNPGTNGVYGTLADITNCPYDTPIEVSHSWSSDFGYTNLCSQGLLGWATEPDGEIVIERSNDASKPEIASNLTAVADGTVTLYAVWDGVGELSEAAGLTNAVLTSTSWVRQTKDDREVVSPVINQNGTYDLEVRLFGRGELTFKWYWKLGNNDRAEFKLYTNDVSSLEMKIKSPSEWKPETVMISSPGETVVKWEMEVEAYVQRNDVCIDDIVWTPFDYRLVLKNGDEEIARQECFLGKVYQLPECTADAPAGRRFAGWRGSDGRRYDDRMLFFMTELPSEPLTLTAIWE